LLCFGIRGSKASTLLEPGKASNKEVGLFTSLIWLHFT
jgi:hypothetical protein